MKQDKYCYYIAITTILGFVLFLSSCAKSSKTEYLENMGNGICRQYPSGLMWQVEKSQKFSSYKDANQYVQSLNLGGYDDWRMPTPDECLKMSTLIQMKKSDCPMETGGNHWVKKTYNTEAGQWESNVYCDGPEFRWIKDKKGTVKAVRP
ncbi:DUF1566 domain-containing protein [Desulfopila sp. IMCC35008]|uniref:Lcl domain-containing protein n=1 Tax=Desulfopila sp. IMCC35008 TaxID=2653858 RepID=UPI0013D28B52|nr:DUF1566 domain-containing protein [Desulfopila sp. IMCC35008]